MKFSFLIVIILAALSCSGQLEVNKNNYAQADTLMQWENGCLHFDGADIKTILGVISALYKVDIICSGNITDTKLTGGIPVGTTLSEILQTLGLFGISCMLKNGKVIVS